MGYRTASPVIECFCRNDITTSVNSLTCISIRSRRIFGKFNTVFIEHHFDDGATCIGGLRLQRDSGRWIKGSPSGRTREADGYCGVGSVRRFKPTKTGS